MTIKPYALWRVTFRIRLSDGSEQEETRLHTGCDPDDVAGRALGIETARFTASQESCPGTSRPDGIRIKRIRRN